MRAAAAEDLPCYGLALAAAFLLRLSFPRPGLWPLAWVALAPLLMALRARPGMNQRTFLIAWLFGTAFSYLNCSWLNTLIQFNPFIPVGIVALALAMGLWVALSGWGWSILRNRYGGLLGGLLGAAWWSGSEWLRTLGPYGFPWGLLGISQQPAVPLIQVTAWTGVYGLTFLIVLANGFVADWTLAWLAVREIRRAKGEGGPAAEKLHAAFRRTTLWVVLVGGAVALLGAWGWVRAGSLEKRISQNSERDQTQLHVAVLQPNVMQAVKWESYTSADESHRDELQRGMISELLNRLDSLATTDERFDLIVTPESAITTPYFNQEMHRSLREELSSRARDLDAPILLGADDTILYTQDGQPTQDLTQAVNPETGMAWKQDMFVAAWLVPSGRPFDPTAVYHKVRLVPFGEWLPWFSVIPGFQEHVVQIGSFTPGKEPVVFDVSVKHGGWEPKAREAGDLSTTLEEDRMSEALNRLEPPQIRIATSICFESVFSDLHRWMARRGADLLFNVTNDAWYGRTSGPAQHFQIAVLRAVETGRPLVRCANTGITAIVSPAGRVLERVPFYEPGVLKSVVAVERDAPQTLYTRWGDWWAVGCLVIGVAALLMARERTSLPSSGLVSTRTAPPPAP